VKLDVDVIPTDAVSVWLFEDAPDSLREGFADAALLIYVPARLLGHEALDLFRERLPGTAREEGDGALVIAADLDTI